MTSTDANPRGRSPLFFIFLTVFIDLLGFGIVLPLLPIYSLSYQASEAEIGILFGSFSAMQLLFAPMWGRLSDRIGRRPVLIGGLVGTALSYGLFAVADSLPLLFASRILAGFFGANVSTAQAYIADVTTPENRAKGMGMIGAAFGLGFMLGPLIGGELTAVSVHAPGIAAALLSASAALFGWLKLPEPVRKQGPASRLFRFEQVRRAFSDPRLGVLLLLSFLFITAFSSFESMFTLFGIQRFPSWFGIDAAIAHPTHADAMRAAPWAGRYLGVIGLLSAVIQGGFIRRLVPRFGEPALATAGPLILGIAMLVIGSASSFGIVIAGCVLMPFGFGINNPALFGMISRASPSEEQGAYLGLNQSVSSLARMAGPVLGGTLFMQFGARTPFLVAAGILGTSALIAFAYRRRYGASFPRSAKPAAVEAG
jgi:MFS transporter, DHA1 family, tetracycline resistance protein